MEIAPQPRVFYGYIIVAACFFIMVVFWGTLFSYGIFFDSLIKDFGWNRATISGAYSVMGLMFGLTSIPTTRLCDRYGPRIVIGACGAIMGIGYILMSQVQSIWQLYLFFDIFIPVGMGSYISLMPLVVK
jgi:MFS family permease